MNSWGTGISNNDVFKETKARFYNLFDNGLQVKEVTERLIESSQELINDNQKSHNFWFCLASCEWICGEVQCITFEKVAEIINSERDLLLWKSLGAERDILQRRKHVLQKFLEKLKTPRKFQKRRKQMISHLPIFQKGDCLTFKLGNDLYGGAIVLSAIAENESGLNLIAITTILKTSKPTTEDFGNTYILVQKEEFLPNNFNDTKQISWYNSSFFKKSGASFEVIGQIEVNKKYSPRSESLNRISGWHMIAKKVEHHKEICAKHGDPKLQIKLSDYT